MNAARRRVRCGGAPGVLALLVVSYPVFIFSRKAFGQTHSVLEVLYEGVFKRIFFKPAMLSYYQFEMFPTHYPFTGFRDISKIAQLFGMEYVDLSTLTALYSTGTDLANLPPAAFGNFYAQGGWPMLVLGALIVGFVLQAMQIWFVRFSPRNSFALGLLAVLLWCGFRVSMTGFHNIFLSEGIVPTLIFITVWRLWRAGGGAAVPVPPERVAMIERLLRRTALVMLGTGASKGLLLVLELFIARALGAAGYGAFSLGLAMLFVVANAALLGLNFGVIQYLAVHQEEQRPDLVRGVLRTSLVVTALTGVVAAVAVWFGAEALALRVFSKPELAPALRIVAIAIPFETVNQNLSAGFRGLRRFRDHVMVSDLLRNALALGAVLLLSLQKLSLEPVLWVLVLGTAAAT
jgi:hypothetical protein